MDKKRILSLPVWVLPLFMTLYGEVLLHVWTAEPFAWDRFGVVLCFGAAFGALTALITSLLPARAGKWVGIVISLLLSVLYLMEFYMDDAYQIFMPLSVALAGAEGVATTFMGTVLNLLAASWWRIALFLVPIILFAIFVKPTNYSRRCRLILLAMAVVLYAISFGVIHLMPNGYALGLTSAYEFDSAVTSFGLNVALPLDIYHSSGTGQGPSFEIPEAVPDTEAPTATPTEAPAVTETVPEETAAPTEPPVVFEEQTLPIDFAALAESETSKNIASIHSYVASQTPAMENEYTGLFEGKNLILITAEAFTAEVIDPVRTPTLYRMANEGIKFEEYYQPVWGAGTTGGEYTNVVGLVPNGGQCMMESVQQDLFLTMGNQLQKLGYTSAAFHNNDYTYYSRHLTHEKLGYDKFIGYGNGIEAGVKAQWPQSDQEMFEYTIPQYLDKQPFSLYYMTVSGHSNYSKQNNAMSRKNFDLVKDLPYSNTIKSYHAANLELEHSMKFLLEQLEEKGIADDTVVVIAADHYPYGLVQSTTWDTSSDYLKELYGQSATTKFIRDHNALIIWSGCLEDMDIVVEEPTHSLDILPTLSNLFDVEYDSRLLPGRDVFSDAEPIVIWKDYSWVTDKASYSTSSRIFTPKEGAEIEEGYRERIDAIVRNKITYSLSVANYDYFNYLTAELEKNGIG